MNTRTGARVALPVCCAVCALLAASAIAPGSQAARRAVRGAHACPSGKARARQRARSRCRSARAHHGAGGHPAPARPSPTSSAAAPAGAVSGGLPAGSGVASAGPVAPAPPAQTLPGEAGTPGSPPAVAEVQVTAVEYHFLLSRTSVPAGKVILQFVNGGQDEHNLNVVPSAGQAAATFPTSRSKAISSVEVDLRPGVYTLFCSLPGHEQKGMKAALVVQDGA